MSVRWWLTPLRRKARVIFLSLACLSITAILAITHKPTNFSLNSVQRNSLGPLETEVSPVDSKHTCFQEFVQEQKGEYNTRDIFMSIIGGEKTKPYTRKVPEANSKPLEVFVLPFTHVDPGWLRTFDSYSEDTNKILSNLHEFMPKNPKMRFLWAEFVFFERWWSLQNETVKKDIKQLVKSGRLELASGSWVMTDEANAYFPVSVDNIVEGHQFIKQEFGIVPTTIWSNDPFGYSNSVPYLFAKAGIKRNVINRIHHGIKQRLQQMRAIPFKWRQFFDKKGENDVLTQVLPYTHYDVLNSCGPDPNVCCQIDFKRMTHWGCGGGKPQNVTTANVKSLAGHLVNNLVKMGEMYESNVILMMHGDDFRFDMLQEWHQQHDNFLPLFDEINKGNRVKIQFGTFNDYFTSLEKSYKTMNSSPAKVTGDFFPYMCAMGTYWSGYFTTRPFYKRQGRLLHSMLRSADLLLAESWSSLSPTERSEAAEKLTTARRTLSLFQHHDAITGTSKKSVMKDYSKLLFTAFDLTKQVIETSREDQGDYKVNEEPLKYNETVTKQLINPIPKKPITISVFNSLPYLQWDIISVHVSNLDLVVTQNGNPIPAQIEPYIEQGEMVKGSYLLSFRASLLPLRSTNFIISHKDDVLSRRTVSTTQPVVVEILDTSYGLINQLIPKPFESKPVNIKEFGLNTTKVSTKHGENGGLQKIKTEGSNDWITLSQRFATYSRAGGGAYIMNVQQTDEKYAHEVQHSFIFKGPLKQTIHVFGKDATHHSLTAKELDGTVGEQLHWSVRVDIRQRRNTELATRFEIGLSQKTVMYTDSVGLQLIRRDVFTGNNIAANYYPMPSAVVLDDQKMRLSIVSDLEHGCMQYKPTGVEIMLDRILNQDDGKGLGSEKDGIPDDMLPVDMSFTILLERLQESKKETNEHSGYHTLAANIAIQSLLYRPVIMSSDAPNERQAGEPHGLSLPCEYQLLTVRPISNSDEHMLIIFHNGITCTGQSTLTCGATNFKSAVVSYLQQLGVRSVQRTNLGGTSHVGVASPVNNLNADVDVMDFLVLTFRIE